MSKSKRRTQRNGRERGNPGNGGGPLTYTPNVVHKGKHEILARRDKHEKHHGWGE